LLYIEIGMKITLFWLFRWWKY